MVGRGIDIKDVSMVINYDMAKSIEGNLLFNTFKAYQYKHKCIYPNLLTLVWTYFS